MLDHLLANLALTLMAARMSTPPKHLGELKSLIHQADALAESPTKDGAAALLQAANASNLNPADKSGVQAILKRVIRLAP